jgi:hypothetical protein
MEFSSSPVAPDTFSQQGKQLRADLERVYRSPKETAPSIWRDIDVSSTVAKYIPIGTSFDDADRILKAAGFKMAPRPPRPIERESIVKFPEALRFAISGELDLDQTFLVSRTSVIVILSPDSPGDPNAHVKEIHASIMTAYL